VKFDDAAYSLSNFSIDDFPPLLFREDSFDPITKVRRGRAYQLAQQTQQSMWRVHDPLRQELESTDWDRGTAQKIELHTYQRCLLGDVLQVRRLPKVILGEQPHCSYWTLLSVEKQFDGSLLLTLKSLRSLGVVPDIDVAFYSPLAQAKLQEALERVELAANRLSPVDMVDRCRDALSIVFGDLAGNLTLDLGNAIKKYIEKNKTAEPKRDGQDLISKTADIVRVLHARGKPNESHKHQTRNLDEEDANLALNCLWFVLTEFNSQNVR